MGVSFESSNEGSLPYIPPQIVENKIVAIPLEEVITQGVQVWENFLVGKLIDAKLPYAVIHRLI